MGPAWFVVPASAGKAAFHLKAGLRTRRCLSKQPLKITCWQRSSNFGQIRTPSPVRGERVAKATAVATAG